MIPRATSGAAMTQTQDRLASLEIALTHQERSVEELNAVILDQATRLERLERQVEMLARRLIVAEEALPGTGAEDRPPPHW
jgi:SlyX protein